MPTIKDACQFGTEDAETGEYVFDSGEAAKQAARALDLPYNYGAVFERREHRLHFKGRRVIGRIPYHDGDQSPGKGWLRRTPRAKVWSALIGEIVQQLPPDERAVLDEQVRCRTADSKSLGWSIRETSGEWRHGDPPDTVRCYLSSRGYKDPRVTMGHLTGDAWTVVTLPFRGEHPGNRQWNLAAPQYTYPPAAGPCPHWDMVLRHCGRGLDAELDTDWALRSGITTGAKYLLAWAASLLRHPERPLPYLFFCGDQNGGKSTYHEALSLLMTRGVASADRAFGSTDFNRELLGAVLATIEERDISKTPGAYQKLKNWVTSPKLSVRAMRTDQYEVPSFLHFIQCANDRDSVPIFPGDSRITIIEVATFGTGEEIPRAVLFSRLREEAPQFMQKIMDLELPALEGRLAIPALDTDAKRRQMEAATDPFIVALADFMLDKEEATLAAKQFTELGDSPLTMRAAKKLIESNVPYLRSRGIVATFPPRTKAGYHVVLQKAV